MAALFCLWDPHDRPRPMRYIRRMLARTESGPGRRHARPIPIVYSACQRRAILILPNGDLPPYIGLVYGQIKSPAGMLRLIRCEADPKRLGDGRSITWTAGELGALCHLDFTGWAEEASR